MKAGRNEIFTHPPPPWVYSATVIRVWRLIGRMFGCAQLETIYPYKVLHLAFPYRRHARHETLGGRRGPSETPWTEFNRLCVCCGTGRSCSSPADDASGEKRKRVEPPRRVVAIKIIERTEAGVVVFPYINLNTRRQTQNIKKRKARNFFNTCKKSNTIIFRKAKFHWVCKKKSLMN